MNKIDILNCLNFEECSHKKKQLGLPFCIPKSRNLAFADLVHKINSKLADWKAGTLSQIGRSVLIPAVACDLPTYHMSIFLLPKNICYKLDASFRKFWWGENSNGNSYTLFAGLSGGLDFRRMLDTNKALLAKLAWNLTSSKDNKCTKLLAAKYLASLPFLNNDRSPSTPSWIWIDICKTKNLINK